MELPINVIVVLFVAIIVGASIIFFAKDELFFARETLENLDGSDASIQGQGFIEVNSFSENDLMTLIDECEKIAENNVVSTINCYSIYSITNMTISNDSVIASHSEVEMNSDATGNSLFIKYNPLLNDNKKIEILT